MKKTSHQKFSVNLKYFPLKTIQYGFEAHYKKQL